MSFESLLMMPPMSTKATVSLCILTFWTHDPTVWFTYLEAQFMSMHIRANNARTAYVIGALPPAIILEVCNLIVSPEGIVPYETRVRVDTTCVRIGEDLSTPIADHRSWEIKDLPNFSNEWNNCLGTRSLTQLYWSNCLSNAYQPHYNIFLLLRKKQWTWTTWQSWQTTSQRFRYPSQMSRT